MRYIFQFIIIVLILTGCSSIYKKKIVPVIILKPDNTNEQLITSKSLDIVPRLPKIKKIDLLTPITSLVKGLVEANVVKLREILLINSINNNTNISIQSTQIIDFIINVINNQNIFKLVPKNLVENARKALGLSQEDNLVTRSKAIALSRYLQADYVLYSIISNNQKHSKIEMQLMKSRTGEILWSGANNIE
ncbi:MAG: penicillin-binding protein activator LpoB [Arsenophonus sp. ER-BJ3-MAG3]